MTDTYKVRMTVLALVKESDSRFSTQDIAMELAESAGLTVLHVEEPEKVVAPSRFRDEEDIYP